jgi:acyl-CoA thioester hydrolase
MRHLYSGNYFRYFLDAREDQVLEAYDLDFQKLAREEGIAWVVAQNRISFMREARVNEHVKISSCVIWFNERFMEAEFIMWSRDLKEIKAFQWSRFALIDIMHRETVDATKRFGELFDKAFVKIKENNYDDRFKFIRKYNKGEVSHIY